MLMFIFHSKHFVYYETQQKWFKICCLFPSRNQNMTQYVINPNGGPYLYDLVAVVNHYGGLGGGHCKYIIMFELQNSSGSCD